MFIDMSLPLSSHCITVPALISLQQLTASHCYSRRSHNNRILAAVAVYTDIGDKTAVDRGVSSDRFFNVQRVNQCNKKICVRDNTAFRC